jgi:uncharacterized protein YkwD
VPARERRAREGHVERSLDKMARLLPLTLLFPLTLTSCAAAAQPVSRPRAVTPVPTAAEYRTGALAVLRRANEVRAEAGARVLTEDVALTNAAQRYAEELARLQHLEHGSATPGLHTMTQRIEAAGGAWRRAAENLATTYRVSDTDHAVIDMWLRSPGHRRNLLDTGFTRTGVGAARDPRGAWYFVQLYVLPPAGR